MSESMSVNIHLWDRKNAGISVRLDQLTSKSELHAIVRLIPEVNHYGNVSAFLNIEQVKILHDQLGQVIHEHALREAKENGLIVVRCIDSTGLSSDYPLTFGKTYVARLHEQDETCYLVVADNGVEGGFFYGRFEVVQDAENE